MIGIRLTGRALQDLSEGIAFYDDQEPGIGDYFARCLESEIEGMKVTAGIHRQYDADYHRLISRTFPYAIFYTFSDETAVIWAVVDCRRNPEWIQAHLEE